MVGMVGMVVEMMATMRMAMMMVNGRMMVVMMMVTVSMMGMMGMMEMMGLMGMMVMMRSHWDMGPLRHLFQLPVGGMATLRLVSSAFLFCCAIMDRVLL